MFIKIGVTMNKEIITLGIESSCDETSVSVVKNGREILSNVIDSQINIHEKYGGVVPEIASRNHIEAISRVTKMALEEANITFPYTVPNDTYFVLNDYRPDPTDSRMYGGIPKTDTKGKIFLMLRRRGF